MIDLDDFLEDQLSTLARHWETTAPPIRLEEAMARAETRGIAALIDADGNDDADFDDRYDPDEPLVVVSAVDREPNRRWKPLSMIGAAAALVVVGLVVLANRDSNDREPFRPGIDTVAPEPTAQVTVTTSATTTGGTSPAPPTTPPNTPPATPPATSPTVSVSAAIDPAAQVLSPIQSSVAASLATFDTFRATATSQSSTTEAGGEPVDGPVTVNEVTMAADGSVWATGSPITWQSYDASTGIARTGNPSTNTYMQLNLDPVPLGLVMGLAPIPRFDELGTNVDIGETLQDGRQVWEINAIRDVTGPNGVEHRDETFEIDKATGLVIGYTKTSTTSGTTTVQTATLSNLVLNVDFPPPEFPGTFPPGADVPGADQQNALQLLTVDEAATRFGAGFVVTPDLPQSARITFESSIVPTSATGGVVIMDSSPGLKVTMAFHSGFAPTTITIQKDADTGLGAPSGDAGSVCRTVDGKTCLGADGASVVTAGAMKGVPSDLRLGVLTIHDGVRTVTIRAPSDQQALALANSLVSVG